MVQKIACLHSFVTVKTSSLTAYIITSPFSLHVRLNQTPWGPVRLLSEICTYKSYIRRGKKNEWGLNEKHKEEHRNDFLQIVYIIYDIFYLYYLLYIIYDIYVYVYTYTYIHTVVRWFVGNHSFPNYQDKRGWQNGRKEITRKQKHCGELRKEGETDGKGHDYSALNCVIWLFSSSLLYLRCKGQNISCCSLQA